MNTPYKPERKQLDSWQDQNPRDEACLIAIAAWCNVTVEQLPERFRLHTCEATMIAWQRVVDALIAWNTRATDAAIPINCREWNYYPIQMPLNNQGQGPATIGDDASSITYEVWDRLLITCASFDNLPDAINESIRLILEGEK